MAEKVTTLHTILQDCTEDQLYALAYSALNAWGQNRIELDDGLDAKQAMLDALGANMPGDHPLWKHAEEPDDELEMCRRWRKLMNYVPIDEEGNEIDKGETVDLPHGSYPVGIIEGGSIGARPFYSVHDPETGETWGYAIPDPRDQASRNYVSVLHPPETVDPSDYDADEARTFPDATHIVREQPGTNFFEDNFFTGTYREVLANIYDEHAQRYLTQETADQEASDE